MNRDECRLQEIKLFKSVYYAELSKAESISDCILLKGHIDNLEKEEQDILKRCDAL